MDRVVEQTGETVQLARLDGMEYAYLAISESPQPMKLVSAVGKRLFAHATGLGKVLLAGLGEAELRRRLAPVNLPRFTLNTLVDHDALLGEVNDVRARGYATDNEEYVIGCPCIAMPIRNAAGDVVAAMSVSIPTPRYSDELAARIHARLGEAVAELSERLGYLQGATRQPVGPSVRRYGTALISSVGDPPPPPWRPGGSSSGRSHCGSPCSLRFRRFPRPCPRHRWPVSPSRHRLV